MICEPQDHLHELKAAGLIEGFTWADNTWHVRLPANELTPGTTTYLNDDHLEAFATAMTHGALMASRLTANQIENLHYYVKEEQ